MSDPSLRQALEELLETAAATPAEPQMTPKERGKAVEELFTLMESPKLHRIFTTSAIYFDGDGDEAIYDAAHELLIALGLETEESIAAAEASEDAVVKNELDFQASMFLVLFNHALREMKLKTVEHAIKLLKEAVPPPQQESPDE